MSGGFAKAWRKRWDHPVFLNKQEAAVWAWMTDTACYKEYRFRTAHGIVELKRGQLLISERKLAEDFGLSRHRLRALMGALVQEGMISLNSDHSAKKSGTIVSIVNYEKYQSVSEVHEDIDNQSPAIEPTSGQPVANQSPTKREEGKEVKKDKKDITPSGALSATDDDLTEVEVYRFGKSVLGPKAGGVITKVKKLADHHLPEVMRLLRMAAEKENPMEWIQGVIRASEMKAFRGIDGYNPPKAETLIRDREDREFWERQKRLMAGVL